MKGPETLAAAVFFTGIGILAAVSVWLGIHPAVVAPALMLIWVVGAVAVRDLVGEAVDEIRRQPVRMARRVMDAAQGSVLDREWTRRLARGVFSTMYPQRWETVTVGGVLARFWISDHVAERYVDGHEEQTQAWLAKRLEPGDSVLDAGAHHGFWTVLFALHVGPEGHVVAVEPNAQNREVLEKNLRENGVRERVDLVPGPVQEYELEGFDVAKVDVEGDEVEALASGALDLRGCRAAVVEVHPDRLRARGVEPGMVEALLAEQGLDAVGGAYRDGGPWHVFAAPVDEAEREVSAWT